MRKYASVMVALLAGLAIGYFVRPTARVRGPASPGDSIVVHHSDRTERLTIQRAIVARSATTPEEYHNLGKIWIVQVGDTIYLATP